MDNWIVAELGPRLRAVPEPLVVDLGFGASAVTTVELAARLVRVQPSVRVLGLEIDRDRVAAAAPAADPPRLDFRVGGFELAGERPRLVRAANVLRQYDQQSAARAWETLRAAVDPAGVIVEGTCDEVGRLGGWVLLDRGGPVSLTLAARLQSLTRPGELAERLPKALIHSNVPGQPVFDFLAALDSAWDSAAALSPFGPRQRWIAACAAVAGDWPVRTGRARHGEITVDWPAVAPR